MIAAKQKAVALTTASTTNQHNESYRNSVSASRAKLQIGTPLLALQAPLSQEQQRKHWQLFESKLRQYVGLKICGGKYEYRATQKKIAERRPFCKGHE